jgi:hypothetical protein
VTSPKAVARIAGALYLVLAAGSGFAFVYLNSRIVESDNAAATADNIRSSTALFRTAFVSDLVGTTFFLFTAMALYVLLKHVNQLVATAMVTIVAISVAIQSLNLLNQYTALRIATNDAYTRIFGKEGSDALTMLFMDRHHDGGLLVAQMFFGLWLLPLGYLVIKSGFFPKVLGVLLIGACFAYLAELFLGIITPDSGDSIATFTGPIQAIAELSFIAWLLFKGVSSQHVGGSLVSGESATR